MDKEYKDWKRKVRAYMGEWWIDPPLKHINCMVVNFYGPCRGDLDNRIGSVMDAGNGLIWADDNVNVIRAIAARHVKSSVKEAHIRMKLIWETQ
jgi:Holliday junction resolvase RusA-like endonuclease